MGSSRLRVLLLGLAALAAAWIVYRFVDFVGGKDRLLSPWNESRARAGVREEGRPEQARLARGFDAYAVLWELEGNRKAAETASEIQLPPPPPPLGVADLLRVICVQFDAGDPSGTRRFDLEGFSGHAAFVQFKEAALADGTPSLLCVGDRLPAPHREVEVKAIFPERVLFDRGGSAEEVPVLGPLVASDPAAKVLSELGATAETRRTAPADPSSARRAEGAERTREVRPDVWVLSRGDRDALRPDSNDVVLTPAWPRGGSQPTGLRVGIPAGSIFEGKGLKSGDVVRSINGVPIRSREQALKCLEAERDLRSLSLEIERLGRPRTLRYSLPR